MAVALFDVLPGGDRRGGRRASASAASRGSASSSSSSRYRLLVLHHRDPDEQAKGHAQVGALGAAGLSIHSFVDGLGIGLAFNLSTATGLLVFVAVVSHDFADGLNTVSFVLRQGGTIERARAVGWPSTRSLRCSARSSARSCSTSPSEQLGTLLALYAGFFLYMGASDLLPEAHEHPSWRRVGLTVTGFAVIFAISLAVNA